MSHIQFDSPSQSTRIQGPEFHYGVHLCNRLAATVGDRELLEPLLPASLLNSQGYRDRGNIAFQDWLKTEEGEGFLLFTGETISPTAVVVNTAWRIGGDALKLLTRVCFQSAYHAYVEGPNRNWLADIIEQGRAHNILRSTLGWDSLVEMLRARDDEPVVTSSSFDNGFPFMPPGYSEEMWAILTEAQQWEVALPYLRTLNETQHLEMCPETWESYSFGHGYSIFDLMEMVSPLPPAPG